jgi:hypothetical protein
MGCLTCGIMAIMAGQDINWDLRNYHHYSAYAFLNNRIGFDVAPAGIQSYLNPIASIPHYLLSLKFKPVLTSFFIGMIQGLNLFLLYLVNFEAVGKTKYREAISVLLAISGILTPIFIGEIGSTYTDTLICVPVLLSVYLLIKNGGNQLCNFKASGLALGIAVGLKLTFLCYLIGLAIALFIISRRHVAQWLLFCFLGIAISSGYWMLLMYINFESPLFPFYNKIFNSTFYPNINFADIREIPNSLIDKIIYPFTLNIFNNSNIQNIRMPLILSILPIIIWRYKAITFNKSDILLIVFYFSSYLVWLNKFSIYRYSAPLELIAPTILAILFLRINVKPHLLILTILLVTASTRVSSFSERTDWGPTYFSIIETSLLLEEKPGIVLIIHSGIPNSYIAPYLPSSYRLIRIGNGEWGDFTKNLFGENSKLSKIGMDIISHSSEDIYLVTSVNEKQYNIEVLKRYKLSLIESSEKNVSHSDKNLKIYKVLRN